MKYINVKINGVVETVDEFETYKEAQAIRNEYNLSDIYNYYYISSRSTKKWRDK